MQPGRTPFSVKYCSTPSLDGHHKYQNSYEHISLDNMKSQLNRTVYFGEFVLSFLRPCNLIYYKSYIVTTS
jgi:hypothetical protein